MRARKNLVADLIELLDGEYAGERSLRVAIVTCTDHLFARRKGGEYETVAQSSDLDSADEALSWLSGAQPAAINDPLCAPVEDMLQVSLTLLSGSGRLKRRPRLVTLAGRPPHPYPQRADGTMPCPLKYAWDLILRDLDAAGARYAVVADKLPAPRSDARDIWNRLGPAGQRALPTATARQLAEDLGLLASPSQRIPIPLTDG